MTLLSLALPPVLLALALLPYAIFLSRKARSADRYQRYSDVGLRLAISQAQGYRSSQVRLLEDLLAEVRRQSNYLSFLCTQLADQSEATPQLGTQYTSAPALPTDPSSRSLSSISLQGRDMTLDVNVPLGGLDPRLVAILAEASSEVAANQLPECLVEHSTQEPEISNGGE